MCIALPMTILVIWSIIWAYNDANKRGKSGCLVALMVFFVTWPAGLIIWLVFRPEEKEPPR
jgi:cbb3-type cytochrome oxidase subunit 3